jgi:inosine/xanthosine triphosphate pyrophosphatase family protein
MTIAQLPLEEKNRISHRANATGRAMDLLNGVREFSA